jgi:hypothetical protein
VNPAARLRTSAPTGFIAPLRISRSDVEANPMNRHGFALSCRRLLRGTGA